MRFQIIPKNHIHKQTPTDTRQSVFTELYTVLACALVTSFNVNTTTVRTHIVESETFVDI